MAADFFNSVKKAFGSVVNEVKKDVPVIWGGIKPIANTLYNDAKGGLSNIGNAAKSVGQFVGKEEDKIIGSATGLVNHVGGFVDSVSEFLPMIIIGVVAIGGLYLMNSNGKRSRESYHESDYEYGRPQKRPFYSPSYAFNY